MPVGEDISPLGPAYTDAAIAMLDRAGPVVGLGQFLKSKVDSVNVLTVAAKEGYTPVAGDLVSLDPSGNYLVAPTASGKPLEAKVVGDVSNPQEIKIALYTPGHRDRFPYKGSKPALGGGIQVG